MMVFDVVTGGDGDAGEFGDAGDLGDVGDEGALTQRGDSTRGEHWRQVRQ